MTPALTGGLVGGLTVFGAGYAWYHFSGTKKVVSSATQAVQSYESAKQKLMEKTPEPKEALRWVRSMAQSYAAFIPGAKPILDTAFDDLDKISEKHGDKVDKIVTDTYNQLKDVVKDGGVNMETAQKAYSILQKKLDEVKQIAGDVGSDILNSHPELKDKVGGKFTDMKELAEKAGPDAKKQMDDVYNRIQDIAKGGLTAGSIAEVSKLVSEKYDDIKKMAGKAGEEAWSKGMETAKPYLEKYPEAKKFIDENADALKSGNMEELISAVKKAVDSKDLGSLQQYADKAKSMAKGAGLEGYLKNIPHADEIMSHFSQLQEISKKHGKEAEELAKDTYQEITDVLKKKVGEAQKLADKAKKDAK